jgi:hypothetical protein
MKYSGDSKQLVAHFQGARGLFTFDLRKQKQLNYYPLHYYPITDFDIGKERFSNIAVSSGTTYHMQYDVRPINIARPVNEIDPEYKI